MTKADAADMLFRGEHAAVQYQRGNQPRQPGATVIKSPAESHRHDLVAGGGERHHLGGGGNIGGREGETADNFSGFVFPANLVISFSFFMFLQLFAMTLSFVVNGHLQPLKNLTKKYPIIYHMFTNLSPVSRGMIYLPPEQYADC
jgi:hypothetical protein